MKFLKGGCDVFFCCKYSPVAKASKGFGPGLTKSQATALGLLSYGMVILDGCGMTRLSNGLAKIEQVPANRLRQRLREFYYEAEAKRGKKRREVDVQTCFGDLLRGVLLSRQAQALVSSN